MSKCYPYLGKFTVTSKYGLRKAVSTTEGTSSTGHRGLDMAATTGQSKDIVSCTEGTVVKVGETRLRGKYIIVQGNDGFSCLYQHLARTYVSEGQSVSAKQRIGLQGATGNVSGAHLHLEVGKGTTEGQVYNSTINPADYLGMQNTSTIVGKTFDGSGYITGEPDGITSSNNSNQIVSSESTTTVTGQGYTDILLPSGEYYQIREDSFAESDWLYGRRYRIFVEIEGNKAFEVSDLRCVFEITKTSYMEANTSIVQIYNLNPDDENKLIKQGQRIIIEAGYVGSQYGKIFGGNIIQPIRSKENGTDYVLTLVSMDNDRYVAYGLINVALVAGQSARDAVDALATKAMVSSEIGSVSQLNTVYPRGKVLFGMSNEYLAQIAQTENGTYYSEDGKINIIKTVQSPSNVIKSYGPRNGLIGNPTQTEMGINCKVLLDPSVKTNGFFHIDNEKVTGLQYTQGQPIRQLDNEGIYRIVRFTHKGDTRGNDWYTEIEAVSQAGLLPSMIAGDAFYAW